MADYFHVLPSISLTKPSSPSTTGSNAHLKSALKEKCTPPAPSAVRSLARVLRAANSVLSTPTCKDPKEDGEREEERRHDERKRILALRMKNVSSWRSHSAACIANHAS